MSTFHSDQKSGVMAAVLRTLGKRVPHKVLGNRVTAAARTELAQRSGGGIYVTLFWEQRDGEDTVLVRVTAREPGASFLIRAEPQLALDVYYHPFAYRDQGRRQRIVTTAQEQGTRSRGWRSRRSLGVSGADS